MMKLTTLLLCFVLSTLLTANSYADNTSLIEKINHLLEDEKYIIWDTANILKADVAWGENVDYIVGGRTDIEFVLAVVNGANTKKYHIMKFDNVDSFCDPTQIKLLVLPHHDYQFHKTTRKKLSIVLDDYTCDPNLIVWNKKKKVFEVFRN